MSNDIRLSEISQHIAQPSITNTGFKKVHLKFCSNLSGVNELTDRLVYWANGVVPSGNQAIT